ncbi:Connector enhancer of kinase suppressor of ras 2 [Holothuria leucospilota]|uniref:Connector enhancer of kinase suppressor of ras 2 n=1 Tax=Holothuria leucospilota TaxID=206669 RepID=A0A9Q0YUB3_HOLLE|nr:Connector enhancer of kinase suppressor of ras 2 [Holothuria leucospilota]
MANSYEKENEKQSYPEKGVKKALRQKTDKNNESSCSSSDGNKEENRHPQLYTRDGVVMRKPREKKKARQDVFSRRITCHKLGPGTCEGWLLKKSENRTLISKSWIRMFFKLKEFVLYYYKDKEKVFTAVINFSVLIFVRAMKIFHRGTGKKFHIAAERQSDWETWLKHLQLAATIYANTDNVRSSRIFTDKYGDAPPSTDEKHILISCYLLPVSYELDYIQEVSICKDLHLVIWGNDYDKTIDFNAMHQLIEKYENSDFTIGSPIFYVTTRWHSIADFALPLMRPAYSGYHSESDDEMDEKQEFTREHIIETVAKLSALRRTIEAKRRALSEMDKLLDQNITSESIKVWERDHPDLLQGIRTNRNVKRDLSVSDECEGRSASGYAQHLTNGTPASPAVRQQVRALRNNGPCLSDEENKMRHERCKEMLMIRKHREMTSNEEISTRL